MKRCKLCGRLLISNSNCYGLNCLGKVCALEGLLDIKNLKAENDLNDKVQKEMGKYMLSKSKKQILTERYLTFKLLKKVDINYYQELAIKVEQDIKRIDNTTKENDLFSNSMIALKEAFEIYNLYNRYVKLKKEAEIILSSEQFEEIQNLAWDTIMFAYSMYYNRKTHLSYLTKTIQLFAWYLIVWILEHSNLSCTAEFLKYSLNESHEDRYITDGIVIDKIKNDNNFKDKINEIIKKYGSANVFDTKNKESLNYEQTDLFLSLNNTNLNVKGKKEKDKWKLDVTITDRYDFTDFKELNDYYDGNIFKSFLGSSANNLAMLSTASKVIKEYNITINFFMEVPLF